MRETINRSLPVRSLAVLGLLVLAGSPADTPAAPTRAQKCLAAKAKALGALVDARAQCQAQARLGGDPVDAACLRKADAKLRAQFAKADKGGACPGDVAGALGKAAACVTSFDGVTTGSASCAARKIKAAGKIAVGKSNCAKRAALKGIAVEACLQKVDKALAAAVKKADRKGTCSGTAAAVEALVDGCLVAPPPPTPCQGDPGFPACNGTCAGGFACRPYEVFAGGASVETGCSCVDVAQGPECSGSTCGTDRHCPDPGHVCERWMTGNPPACDHMVCQPAMTTPTTLPPSDKPIDCVGGEFPTCGGTCRDGGRCQPLEVFFTDDVSFIDVPVFGGCACVDPRGPRCEMPTECRIDVLPGAHCADPTKTCLVTLTSLEPPICRKARCGEPVALPPSSTTTTYTTSTSTVSSTTSTSTSTTVPCVSTPATSGCFRDLGDCTILDTCTGLQWEKKTTSPGPGSRHHVADRYAWSGCCDHQCARLETHCQPNEAAAATCRALAEGAEGCDVCATGTCVVDVFNLGVTTTVWDWLNQLNADDFAGHDDWRLAREAGFSQTGDRELESILLMPFPCTTPPLPCIDPIFGPTMPETYWSATTKGRTGPERPSDAWFVDFAQGFWGDSGKWGPHHVRAVRKPSPGE